MLRLVTFDASSTYKGLKTFDCGNKMINTFVHKSLKKRVKKHLSQAYILLDQNEKFVGFYTLDTFSINREIFELPNKPSGLPPIVPVIKLSMLGIDISLQKQGIGKRLLQDALLKVVDISKIAGCTGIYLLAEVEAVSFYKKLGFVVLNDAMPLSMFLHIEKILGSIDG
ncbi:MAG: GNAT family N-acetyltransferase [Sulfurovum sp.]|nr:MAG: GNAT family N-acetyltransferase [Sulfurovum sp.]